MSFQEIPILDLQEAFDETTKPQFLVKLRDAVINVGFLLLKNYESLGPTKEELEDIKEQAIEFFALPEQVKQRVEMINSPHFLGYTRLANEITASQSGENRLILQPNCQHQKQVNLYTETSRDPIYGQIRKKYQSSDQR